MAANVLIGLLRRFDPQERRSSAQRKTKALIQLSHAIIMLMALHCEKCTLAICSIIFRGKMKPKLSTLFNEAGWSQVLKNVSFIAKQKRKLHLIFYTCC
jgi:hypothetical protein